MGEKCDLHGEKFSNSLVTKSEGSRLKRSVSRRKFNIETVLKNLVGECVFWIRLVLGKDWRTVVKTELYFRIL